MPKKIKGSALLSALFLMTLIAIAVTAISFRLQQDIYRTNLSINADKIYLASEFIQFWALDNLVHENTPFKAIDEQASILALPSKFQHIYPELTLNARIYDLQARFNLNNLTDKKYIPFFMNLLKELKIKNINAKELSLDLYNWLIPYQPSEIVNASMEYYLSQKPPYFPAKQTMKIISEFRLVKGVTDALYNGLFNEITVLPEITLININTASKSMLLAMTHHKHEEEIDKLIETRIKKGALNGKKIASILKKLGISESAVSLSSQYFLIAGQVSSADLNLYTYTLAKRSLNQEGKMMASILATSINSDF